MKKGVNAKGGLVAEYTAKFEGMAQKAAPKLSKFEQTLKDADPVFFADWQESNQGYGMLLTASQIVENAKNMEVKAKKPVLSQWEIIKAADPYIYEELQNNPHAGYGILLSAHNILEDYKKNNPKN